MKSNTSVVPASRILKSLNTRNYSKNYIKMSYTQISNDYLESLDNTHILLFHEEQKKAEEKQNNVPVKAEDYILQWFYFGDLV